MLGAVVGDGLAAAFDGPEVIDDNEAARADFVTEGLQRVREGGAVRIAGEKPPEVASR